MSTAARSECPSFNPRPRMRGDLQGRPHYGFVYAFQSTPPHEGRPGLIENLEQYKAVSIHAPA